MHVRFGQFRLDTGRRQLFRDDAEAHLSPKAYELLRRLIEARPTALSKDVLMRELWPDTFVSEASLSVLVAEIRGALGERASDPRFVRTVHKFGYAFSGDATPLSVAPSAVSGGPSHWLVLGTRRFPLAEGENLIGRDPQAAVWCDQAGISRRHARIVIASGEATIEDLKSKNGTHVGDTRIVTPTRLNSGDAIRLAGVSFEFRAASSGMTTETQGVSGGSNPSSS
jgi:DNA-binding winged helix-turn-helix (wHTH) protein